MQTKIISYDYVFFRAGGVVCLSYSHHHNVDTIIELNVGIFLLKNNFKLSMGGMIIRRCRVEFTEHHVDGLPNILYIQVTLTCFGFSNE